MMKKNFFGKVILAMAIAMLPMAAWAQDQFKGFVSVHDTDDDGEVDQLRFQYGVPAVYGGTEGVDYYLTDNTPLADTPEWYSIRTKIKSIDFLPSFRNARPQSGRSWFHGMRNLEEIKNLQYLNTSEMQTMAYMFFECSKLTSLDISTFDTGNVESMIYMFYNCGKPR